MRKIRLGKGFKIKGDKVEKSDAHLDVSARLRRKAARNKPRIVSRAKAGKP